MMSKGVSVGGREGGRGNAAHAFCYRMSMGVVMVVSCGCSTSVRRGVLSYS
jgi:hypothetical protein